MLCWWLCVQYIKYKIGTRLLLTQCTHIYVHSVIHCQITDTKLRSTPCYDSTMQLASYLVAKLMHELFCTYVYLSTHDGYIQILQNNVLSTLYWLPCISHNKNKVIYKQDDQNWCCETHFQSHFHFVQGDFIGAAV